MYKSSKYGQKPETEPNQDENECNGNHLSFQGLKTNTHSQTHTKTHKAREMEKVSGGYGGEFYRDTENKLTCGGGEDVFSKKHRRRG